MAGRRSLFSPRSERTPPTRSDGNGVLRDLRLLKLALAVSTLRPSQHRLGPARSKPLALRSPLGSRLVTSSQRLLSLDPPCSLQDLRRLGLAREALTPSEHRLGQAEIRPFALRSPLGLRLVTWSCRLLSLLEPCLRSSSLPEIEADLVASELSLPERVTRSSVTDFSISVVLLSLFCGFSYCAVDLVTFGICQPDLVNSVCSRLVWATGLGVYNFTPSVGDGAGNAGSVGIDQWSSHLPQFAHKHITYGELKTTWKIPVLKSNQPFPENDTASQSSLTL
jgi:hypothetical protein